ncbi:MAG TPA: hypothetical protein VF070_06815 [Streptosporangiaceae bacterium]
MSERKRAPRRLPSRRGGGSRCGSKPAGRSEALARRQTWAALGVGLPAPQVRWQACPQYSDAVLATLAKDPAPPSA